MVVDPCLRIAHDINDAQVRGDELAVRHRRGVEDELIDAGEHTVAVQNAVENARLESVEIVAPGAALGSRGIVVRPGIGQRRAVPIEALGAPAGLGIAGPGRNDGAHERRGTRNRVEIAEHDERCMCP
jgi:hypothetical protein